MFQNYEDRGKQFKAVVQKMARQKSEKNEVNV
jgi:hypothetical protein